MECIFRLRDQLGLIWRVIEKLSTVKNNHEKFIGAMFSVELNHCDAVQLLIEKGNFPSADALARPMLETTIRSIQLHRIANESQINEYILGDKFKSTRELIEEIESSHNLPPSLVLKIESFCGVSAQGSALRIVEQEANRCVPCKMA